jgi:hypothetical protein
MDWVGESEDKRVVLAVARIRATDKTDYRGSVFFNPGVSLFGYPQSTEADSLVSGSWWLRRMVLESPRKTSAGYRWKESR